MSGGGKSSTSTSSVSIPPEVLARYNAVNARAEEVAKQGFTPYSGQFVAPLTSTQQAGISNISQAAGTAQPYYQQAYGALLSGAAQAQPYYQAAAQGLSGGQAAASPLQQAAAANITGAQAGAQPYQQMATGYGLAGARQIDPRALNVGAYMSPYVEAVAQPTFQAMRQQQEQEQQRILGEQIRGGAFGGDRGRIAQAVLAQQQGMATAKAMGDIYQQGYGQALGAAQQQQQLGLAAEQANRQAQQQAAQQFLGIGQQAFGQGMSAAQQQAALANQLFSQGASAAQVQQALGQGLYGIGAGVSQGLGGIGAGAQQAGLQGGQAQLAAGTVEQQTQQALNQALYNQFLQQQGYPFQVAQFLANIAMGTGALSGSTTTTTQPQSFFSDERLKENVQPIGKTFDGQDIVRFKYKGEPGTRIGLVAQDVEKKHPEAVGLAGGYKTVDYDAATDEAAARAPKAYGGGLNPWDGSSMGGGVFREHAGQGFAVGGAPGQEDILAQINALVNSHQGMYPYGKAGMYGSTMGKAGPYGSAIMPSQQRQLMLARPVSPPPPSGIEEFETAMKRAENIGKAYQGTRGGLGWLSEQSKISPEYAAGTYGPQLPGAPAAEPRTIRDYFESYTGNRGFAGEPPVPEPAAGVARGGAIRPGLAVGGMPYGEARDEYIPEELTKPLMPQTLQAPKTPSQPQSGLGNIASLAGLGSKAWEVGVPFLKDTVAGIGSYLGGLGGAAEGAELVALAALSRGGVVPRRGYDNGGQVPEGYLDYIAARESNRPDATNPEFPVERGGPSGRYQFTRPTFLDLARNDPQFAGKSEDEILAARNNPTIAAVYAQRYAEQNAPVLQRAGFDPNRENLALAHMQGPGGATALLSRPSENVIDALATAYGGDRSRAEEVVRQNRGTADMTADQFRAHLLSRGQASGLAAPTTGVTGPTAPTPRPSGLGQTLARPTTRQPEEGTWLERRLEANQNWLVPLLTGLGTMAASPSRYLGSAILQGLAGGAQSYAGLGRTAEEQALRRGELAERQRATDISSRQADIAEQQRALELLRFMQSRYTPFSRTNAAGQMETAYRDQVTGRILSEDEYQREMSTYAARASSLTGAPGLAPPAGTPAPTAGSSTTGLAPPPPPPAPAAAPPPPSAERTAVAAPPTAAAPPPAATTETAPAPPIQQQINAAPVQWETIEPKDNPNYLLQQRNRLYETREYERSRGLLSVSDDRYRTLTESINKYDEDINAIISGARPMLRRDGTLDNTYVDLRQVREAEAAGRSAYESAVAAGAAAPSMTPSGAQVRPAPRPYTPTTRLPPAGASNQPPAGRPVEGAQPAAAPATAPGRAELPRNSATVNTYRPAAPEGGGYPVARTAPGERVTEISLPARQMAEADANYRASSGVVPSTDDLISRINAMADSLKLFESGAITGTQQFWARYAEALGNPAIARAIMNGDPAGTEWLAKNTVQGVLEQLSAMKPNFAQREFSATLDKGTPTIDLLPRANFAILTEQLARASRMRAWETDWQKAQSEGWESPSAFFEAWSRANPVDVFKQAASRSIGNIRGTSLPSANDLVPGQVYVMPQNADQRTRNLFGGVGPNQVFRFNGFGRPIDVISPEDLMLRRTP